MKKWGANKRICYQISTFQHLQNLDVPVFMVTEREVENYLALIL